MNGSVWSNSPSRTRSRAFGEDKPALVGHLHDLVHRGQRADGVQIARLRRVQARIPLRRHHDRPFVAQRLDELDGAFPAHRQRQHGMGKQDGIANRQNWQDPSARRGFAALVLLIAIGGFNDAEKVASHECPYIKYVYIGRISFPKVAGIERVLGGVT